MHLLGGAPPPCHPLSHFARSFRSGFIPLACGKGSQPPLAAEAFPLIPQGMFVQLGGGACRFCLGTLPSCRFSAFPPGAKFRSACPHFAPYGFTFPLFGRN